MSRKRFVYRLAKEYCESFRCGTFHDVFCRRISPDTSYRSRCGAVTATRAREDRKCGEGGGGGGGRTARVWPRGEDVVARTPSARRVTRKKIRRCVPAVSRSRNRSGSVLVPSRPRAVVTRARRARSHYRRRSRRDHNAVAVEVFVAAVVEVLAASRIFLSRFVRRATRWRSTRSQTVTQYSDNTRADRFFRRLRHRPSGPSCIDNWHWSFAVTLPRRAMLRPGARPTVHRGQPSSRKGRGQPPRAQWWPSPMTDGQHEHRTRSGWWCPRAVVYAELVARRPPSHFRVDDFGCGE